MARRVRLAFFAAVSSVLFLSAPDADATTVKLLSLLEKTERSGLVLHAVVQRTEPRWKVFDASVETVVTVQVLEAVKGELRRGDWFSFIRPGGTMEGQKQWAEGLAEYEPGDEVILFLIPDRETYRAIGIGVGTYRVERFADGLDYVLHAPNVAAVRFDGDRSGEVVAHPQMEPEALHLFLKRIRSYARGIPVQRVPRFTKEGARLLKRLERED